MNNNKVSTVFTVTHPDGRPPPTSRDRFVFKNRTRFIILLLCTLCLSIAQSNTLTLNFTVICMAGDPIDIDRYNSTGTIFQTANGTYYEVINSSGLQLIIIRFDAIVISIYIWKPSLLSEARAVTGSSSNLLEYDEAVLARQHYQISKLEFRQHNHFVMGVNSFLNCLAALLAPVVVNIFVRNDTWDEWWFVWIVHGVVMTLCNIYFMFFGKGEPAEWTKPGYGAKVAPSAPVPATPPRSSPRNCPSSMCLNDKISVSVQTTGLPQCDTCLGHHHCDDTPSPAISHHNKDTSPILPPKGWRPPSAREAFDSLEDYLDAEAQPPPRSAIEPKIVIPPNPEKQQ
ncbi:hypothetical protein GCK32_012582 [Trichostrongylus colubriformis]|uniref:Uncharacterized protein n=1 Tax=Trichostrongylus colubriformis TaxID=6319 RepID=A0AAN8IF23_TRICO